MASAPRAYPLRERADAVGDPGAHLGTGGVAPPPLWRPATSTPRPVAAPTAGAWRAWSASDPVDDAADALAGAIAAELVARAGDGSSFDPEWDDPWDWARGQVDEATGPYGPEIADRVEAEAFDEIVALVEAARDAHEAGDDTW